MVPALDKATSSSSGAMCRQASLDGSAGRVHAWHAHACTTPTGPLCAKQGAPLQSPRYTFDMCWLSLRLWATRMRAHGRGHAFTPGGDAHMASGPDGCGCHGAATARACDHNSDGPACKAGHASAILFDNVEKMHELECEHRSSTLCAPLPFPRPGIPAWGCYAQGCSGLPSTNGNEPPRQHARS
jgi:hypothetical protein